MTAIALILLLQAISPPAPAASVTAAPVTAPVAAPATPAAAPATPDPVSSPADTLQGLEQVYSTTCGQSGILYHAYDDLCEGLRKQIRTYRERIDKEQARAARAALAPKR